MLDSIKQILSMISWPVAALIIFIVLRKSIARFLDRATKISAGKDGITIEALKKDLDETKKTLAGTVATGVPPKREFTDYKKEMKGATADEVESTVRSRPARKSQLESVARPVNVQEFVPEDPQKNQWGKLSERNYRRLTGSVEQMPGNAGIYKVKLQVISTNPMYPLTGSVGFHLHPTFADPDQDVKVMDGKAELFLLSWGSFTVGAEADNGTTRLEFDLATIPGVPEEFRKT
jgi:hypothetical protein